MSLALNINRSKKASGRFFLGFHCVRVGGAYQAMGLRRLPEF